MPIIPRQGIPEGVPTLAQQAPGIEAYPAYHQSKMATQVSAGGMALAEFGVGMKKEKDRLAKIDGYYRAETLKSEAAIALEDAMETARSKPQEIIEGVAMPEGATGDGGAGLVGTTTLVPRSQTLVPDYEAEQEKILKTIAAKAENNPYVMRHLGPTLERLKTQGTIRMSRESLKLQKEETAATINENIDMQMAELRVKPAVNPVIGDDGIASITLSNDRSYVVARAAVARTIDEASAKGGIDPKTAEQMKQHRLAQMDHGRATQQMLRNPEAWEAASTADKNEWNSRLTTESFEKLNARAHTINQRKETGQNAARLEAQRQWEQDAFTRIRANSKNPLTLGEVDEAVNGTRVLDAEHGEKWRTLVKNVTAGKWDDDGETKVRFGLMSTSPNVSPAIFDQIDRLTRPGGLSLETAIAYKERAKSIIQHRDDQSKQEGYHGYSAAYNSGTSMLTTSPLLGAKMDQDSKTITANYQTALGQYMDTHNWKDALKWQKENLPLYARQLGDRVDSQINVLTQSLPGKVPVDPKTGEVTPDTIKAARIAAFARAGIDPKKAAAMDPDKLPESLHRELDTIDKLREFAEARRALNLKQGPQ